MVVPSTIDEFLECVKGSGLIESAKLERYLEEQEANGRLPAEPKALAGQMVHDGLLTPFQAQQLLEGRHRNFIFGRYKILEPLGAGGMGRVFLCEHIVMKHRVAVKMLPRKKKEDPARVARFFREARAVAALSHPNIVRAHDIDTSNEKYHYIVMDYVSGVNLHDLVQKRGALDPAHAAHYVAQVACGLQHIHEAGLIHRDVKPANLIVDHDGVVKILDLGLARFSDDVDQITKKYNDSTLLGTADFISPEQCMNNGEIDIRSDIYCLGASFYYLLTGHAPFESESMAQKILGHQLRKPRPVSEIRSDVPKELEEILSKMMAKKREARFQTPADVLEALEPWAHIEVPPPSENELPRLSRASQGPQSGRGDSNQRSYHQPMSTPRVASAPTPAPVSIPAPTPTATPASQPRKFNLRTAAVVAGIVILTGVAVYGLVHH